MADLSFIVATHVEEATHSIAKHLIGYATIQYMHQGRLVVEYDQRNYEIEGQWFWPAYPGPFTAFRRAPGCKHWSHRHLAFQGPLVAQWMANGLWPTEPLPAPHTKKWDEYFDEMSRLAMSQTRWGRLRAINMLEGLLLELAESRDIEKPQEPWLVQTLETLSLEGANYIEIAASQGMALSTFRRKFEQATGTPVHKHQLLARIAKARTMLVETDLPIKMIADSLGYQNVYYFSRQFKQFIGISPAKFRSSR